ncbi:MAG: hypothetical protein U0872_08995 [Planctomycetaceae bacterium]
MSEDAGYAAILMKLRRVLSRMLDEEEFFGPYGIRSCPYIMNSIPTR